MFSRVTKISDENECMVNVRGKNCHALLVVKKKRQTRHFDQKRTQGLKQKSTFTQAPCWGFDGNAILLSRVLPKSGGWALSFCEVKCAHGQSCNNSYIVISLLPSGCTSSSLDIMYVLSLPFVSALLSRSALNSNVPERLLNRAWNSA